MSRILIVISFLITFNFGFAQIPPGYYNSAAGLSGEPLRTALFNIIKNHSVKDYTTLWGYFSTTDDNSGAVWDMYTDIPSGTPVYQFSFGFDQCGNYSAEGDCYNREHSVPKSWFNDALPMYSDLFHIYPTDGFVNGQRGNYPFGEVGSVSYTSSNGSVRGTSNYPGYSGIVFEPIDEYKGDFARTYFYMMTRYKDVVSTWSSDMFSGDNLTTWAKTMLVSWDALDPVSQKELDRNNAIYGIQGNRNPFIDNPTWVDWIWGPTASVDEIEDNQIVMYYSQEKLNIENKINKDVELKIYNLLGVQVLNVQLSAGLNTIDLTLPKGVYISTASISNRVYSYKFIN